MATNVLLGGGSTSQVFWFSLSGGVVFHFAFSGIERLETPPKQNVTNANDPANSTAPSSSVSALESQMNQLASEMKSLNINLRSTINDSIGCALATQGKGEAPVSRVEREVYIPHPSLTRMLRKFLGNPKATFKNQEQAEAVEVSMAYDRHLFLVGPTAMGKSLAYMLPAYIRDHGTTCVLLPLSSLHLDFERRCKELKIDSARWTLANNKPRAKIVYVSPEHAQTREFTDWLFESNNLGHIVQMVIDEGHLLATHANFRYCLSALRPLITSGESEVAFIG